MATALAAARALTCALSLCCAAAALAQPRFAFDATPGVLPKDVVPTKYALTLDVDPARDVFTGRASVAITVRKPVTQVVVHAHELTAAAASLVAGGVSRKLSVNADRGSQTWRLVPEDAGPIAAGDYALVIEYSGAVQRSGQGLYRADYTVQGRPARLLATQLEPAFARMLFPGFDEPSFRAAFEIAVRAPDGYDVVSNMPLADRSAQGGATLHRFLPTPSMPPYLVALAVGRFDALAGEAAGVPLRILAAEGKREQARYALEVTQQVVPYYTSYFGLPYALPKLDQLAVPSTRWGAMEDWGLISYAESLLLFDPSASGPETQRGIYSVVAHEVAHQWFGNLVTAASWEEIWLNEAFATWLARKATAKFNPAWQVDLHQRSSVDQAMRRDASSATRAIRSGPVTESAVMDVFDDITYTKGGAVLSMLEAWLGPEVFRQGLAAYLADRKFSNATAGDLWHQMSLASGRDVAAVAASWTDQPGFPLLTVRTRCERGTTRVELAQTRFTDGPPAAGGAPWKIPVRIARGGETASLLMEGPTATLELAGCTGEPVLANAGGAGFYRVEYDGAQLRKLAAGFARLAPADRVTLLADTFALAQTGRVPMASYFALLAAIPPAQAEDRATLYTLAGEGFLFLDRAMAGTAAQRQVRAAARRLLAPELARLGWVPAAGESEESTKLRGVLIAKLAHFDDAAAIARAHRLFDRDESGQQKLPASIRAPVLTAAGMHADRARFDRLLARLKATDSDEDRWTYAEALAGGRDAGRAREFLALSLSGIAPPNVASSFPGLVAESSPFVGLAYDYTLAHWDALAALAGTVGRTWLLPGAASTFNDARQAQRLVADQRAKAGADGAGPAARFAVRIELLAAVRVRESASLGPYLARWRPAPAGAPSSR